MHASVNQGLRIYLGQLGEEETQRLVDINYLNGYTPYVEPKSKQVFILVNNSGDVWRGTDSELKSIEDGLYIFEKDIK